ncbi:MAG: RNase adapter RapZ [Nitrospiraceae bacterium]|nr:RNase adapter RapZ [Nitrospiraceae bacterium]
MPDTKLKVVIVSGLSGAGKTVALRALEDIGYFCIDNLPVGLIEPLMRTLDSGKNNRQVGIGIDIREKQFLQDAYMTISSMKAGYAVEVLFLEAEKNVIVRRYKETRRPHPMLTAVSGEPAQSKADEGTPANIADAIDTEINLLSVIRDSADRIIDTSSDTPHQLRQTIISMYGSGGPSTGLSVSVISFGYKFGVPQNLDLLFDTRFLPNPYFVPQLKQLKGTDKEVADFVLGNSETVEYLSRIKNMLDFVIPLNIKEGKSYLVIGIGCTGGRHRSPVVAQQVVEHLKSSLEVNASLIHRDMDAG